MRIVPRFGGACAALLFAVAAAFGGDPTPQAVTDVQSAAAIQALDAALAKGTWLDHANAVRACGDTDHRLVGDRLASIALDETFRQEVRSAAFEALAGVGTAREGAGRKVERWLRKHSDTDREALAKGDLGVPVDKRSGDVVAKGPAYHAALAAGTARAAWLAGGVRYLASGAAPSEPDALLRPFLESPYDELAVASVAAAGRWKLQKSLPDLLGLFRMYPKENRWESGAVVHTAGSNSSAKAAWLRAFGHPLKQRARPALHNAVRDSVEAITGKRFGAPEELDEFLATSPSERKRSGRR